MKHDIDILIVQLRDGRWTTRAEAARTLSDFPSPLARDDLLRCLKDQEDRVRYWAVRALDRLEGRDLALPLARRLSDSSASVRMVATRALAHRVDREVLGEILAVLDDSHEDVVYWAIQAVVAYGAYAIPQLISSLGHTSWRRREAAAEALYRLGEEAVEPLLLSLDREEPHVSFWAIRTLGRLRSKAAIPRIRTFLDSSRKDLVGVAVDALAALGDRESLQQVVGFLGHEDGELRTRAVEALASYGDFAVKLLADLLDGNRRMVKFAASEALGGSGDGALVPLLEKLKADSDEIRYWAVRALERFDSPVVVSLLADLLTDDSPDVQLAAAEALASFSLPVEFAPRMLRFLAAEDWRVRRAVAKAVAAQEHWPAATFVTWLNDPDEDVRFWAVRVLSGRKDLAVLPLLLGCFEDEAWPIRNAAAEAVASLGHEAVATVQEALLQRAGDLNQRYWLTRSMVGIFDLSLVPSLVNLLGDSDQGVRQNAYDALVAMGDPAVPDLLHSLHTVEQRALREGISRVLVQVGATRLIDILALLDIKHPELNHWGAWILGHLGVVAVPQLADRVRSGSERERVQAMKALAFIRDPRTIQISLEALDDEFPSIRRIALETLGKYQVKEAIPRMLGFLESDEQDLRMAALEAIGQVGGHEQTEAVLKHLTSSRWEVQRSAIVALGRLGDPVSAEPLKKLLVEKHQDLWSFILKALETAGQSRDVPDLVRLIPAVEGVVLPKLIHCIGTLGGPQDAPELAPLLTHPRWEVREAAIEAYGALGEGTDPEPLKALARSEDPLLRALARTALKQVMGHTRWTRMQRGQLKRTLEDPAEEVYQSALTCMRQGQGDEATKLLKKALRLAKRSEFHGLLGALAMERGDRSEALKHYKKACALSPRDPVPKVKLGVVQAMEGQREKAGRTLNEVLSMDLPAPVRELAQRTLARLSQKN